MPELIAPLLAMLIFPILSRSVSWSTILGIVGLYIAILSVAEFIVQWLIGRIAELRKLFIIPVGFALLSFCFFLLPLPISTLRVAIPLFGLASGLILFKVRSISWTFESTKVLATLLGFALLISVNTNIDEMLSSHPLMRTSLFSDNYWFTAMTASLRDGDFNTTIYEKGTGVYHHILGLFPAAFIGAFLDISSHTSLWSMIVPFGIYLSIRILVNFIEWLAKDAIHEKPWLIFLCVVFFVFSYPINPSYLMKLHPNFVWLGPGHTPPTLTTWNSSYIFGIPLVGWYVEAILHERNRLWTSILVFTMFSIMLLWSKVTVYFIVLTGLIIYEVIDHGIYWNRSKLALLTATLVGFGFYFLFYSNSSATFVFDPGYLIEYFSRSSATGTTFKGLLFAVISVLIWGHVKWLLLLTKLRKNMKIVFAFLFVLATCLILMLLFRIHSYGPQGNLMDESSFDLLQFTRSFFMALTVYTTYQLYQLFNTNTSKYACYVRWGSIGFLILVVGGLYIQRYHPSNELTYLQHAWYSEAPNEAANVRDKWKATSSNASYSGQFLSAFDIDRWVCTIRNRQGGYTYSYEHAYRLDLVDSLLKRNSKSDSYKDRLKSEGVEVFIANPDDQPMYDRLEHLGILSRVPGTQWVYEWK